MKSTQADSALLLDLYLLTMGESYLAEALADREATFSLFFRSLPEGWEYTHAAGLEDALGYLERLSFTDSDLAYLDQTGLFSSAFLDRLRNFRFSGSVRAMPEGTAVLPGEPLLEVTAPLVEAQLVETMVLNELHLQTLVAGKTARCVAAADGRLLVDFSLRRTHGGEAGMKVARASWIAGFDATSNVLAGQRLGIPVAGTMAHSYVESFQDERAAFDAYARVYPDTAILLVDTYDTVQGVHNAIATARDLAAAGHRLRGVRLDSGDLLELSGAARALLDEAGFEDAMVFASGGLDEHEIGRLVTAGAPVGGFGVGTKLEASAGAPFLDMAYKLVELDCRPVLKLSEGKATLPGRKQVWRHESYDVLGLAGEPPADEGTALLVDVMANGERTWHEPLEAARARAAEERDTLRGASREVRIDAELEELRARAVGAL
ncbi:MAG TPA: nicotinate phosphoribosyltransferase [Gaiellaceae bacterium]|nr:nicotinate phosphoribosyltransferase [Gaiellaceae bacterium]